MLDPTQVKADRVYDARACARFPKVLATDANVLYFVHYPNFGALAGQGMDTPAVAKTKEYAAATTRALRGGTHFVTAAVTLREFVHTVERLEVEFAWRAKGNRGAFEHKEARYAVAADLKGIRDNVLKYVAVARKSVEVVADAAVEETLRRWHGSYGDVNDSALVASALVAGVADLLSDDADLLTYEGVRLFTANASALDLASKAGRLAKF